VEKEFEKLEEKVISLSFDPSLSYTSKILNLREGSPEMAEVWNSYLHYKNFLLPSLFNNTEILIFLKTNELIFSASFLGIDYKYCWEKKIFRCENLSFEEWYQLLFQKVYKGDIYNLSVIDILDKKIDNLCILWSYPIITQQKNGVILAMWKHEKLYSYLDNLLSSFGSSLIIKRKGDTDYLIKIGNLKQSELDKLCQLNFAQNIIINSNQIIISRTSQKANLQYIVFLPAKVFFKKVNMSIIKFKVFIFIISTLSLLLTFIFTIYNSKPLEDIGNILRNGACPANFKRNFNIYNKSLIELKLDLLELLNKQKSIENYIQEKKSELVYLSLNKLLNGTFTTQKEIDTLLKNCELKIEGNIFAVSVSKVLEPCEFDVEEYYKIWSKTNEVMKKYLENSTTFKMLPIIKTEIENEIVFVFYSFDDSHVLFKENISNFLNSLNEILYLSMRILLKTAVGQFYPSIYEIHISYHQAKSLLNKCLQYNKEILWYENSEINDSFNIYYPPELEDKLIKSCLKGDINESIQIIDTIINKNNVLRSENNQVVTQFLFHELASTLIKICVLLKYEKFDRILSILKCEPNVAIELAKNYLTDICDFAKLNNNKHRDLVNNIIQYVKTNFCDPNLNVFQIAEHFNISSSYASYVFKKYTGENLSDFIERLRVEKAYELLKNDKGISIEEVARKCGYISTNTFRRAFKKIMGTTPSQINK
jgi:AraC-like DNA-binding protein